VRAGVVLALAWVLASCATTEPATPVAPATPATPNTAAAPEQAAPKVVTQAEVEFSTGTAALDAGDFPTAIAHLEKAVELEPGLARNHNNLASAYLAAGRVKDGWPHVRRAVAIDPKDPYAVPNCRVFFVKMREATQLANGDSLEQLREKLGDPDEELREGGAISWRYCLIAVQFRDGRIAGAVDIPSPATP